MRTVLLVLLVCSGCGPVCAQRKGSYLIQSTQRTGDCGPMGEAVVEVGANGPPPPSGCELSWRESEDGCGVTVSQTCRPSSPPGAVVTSTGAVSWDAEGAKGSGVFEMVATSTSSGGCRSTYGVTYTRVTK